MALRLPTTITLLYPYNGNIPRIFPDAHVISLKLRECGIAQLGPLLLSSLLASFIFVKLFMDGSSSANGASLTLGTYDEDPRGLRSSSALMLALSHLRMSSTLAPKTREDQRSSPLVPSFG